MLDTNLDRHLPPRPMFRALLIPTLTLFLLSFGARAANITWDPTNGYQSDEVELSGLLPEEIQKILDWMNSGRKAEEAKNCLLYTSPSPRDA